MYQNAENSECLDAQGLDLRVSSTSNNPLFSAMELSSPTSSYATFQGEFLNPALVVPELKENVGSTNLFKVPSPTYKRNTNHGRLPWQEKGVFQFFHFPMGEPIDEKKKVVGQCKLCHYKRLISGSKNVTSNFIKHLRAAHNQMYCEFENYKKSINSCKVNSGTNGYHQAQQARLSQEAAMKSSSTVSLGSNPGTSGLSQEIQLFPVKTEPGTSSLSPVGSQNEFDRHLLNFIIQGLQPISMVEDSSFITYTKSLRPDVQLLTGEAVKALLIKEKEKLIGSINAAFATVQYICTTMDVWSSRDTIFMGMSAHWLEEETLERKSVALCCKAFSGSHTHEKILAELIRDTHALYGIEGKVVKIVTDNLLYPANDLVKREEVRLENYDEPFTVDHHDAGSFLNLCNKIMIPEHQYCAEHSLNLVVSKDSLMALDINPAYNMLYLESIGKCQSIWMCISSNPTRAQEIVETLLQHPLVLKNGSTWRSDYEAVRSILQNERRINELCISLGVPQFLQKHISFLKEYISLLNPISKGISVLQEEKQSPLGYLLPTLSVIKKRISSVKTSSCCTLQTVLLEAIDTRFADYLDSKDCLLSSICNPKFKLSWVEEAGQREEMARILKDAVSEFGWGGGDEDDFFGHRSPGTSSLSSLSAPHLHYLSDERTGLDMLASHPQVKALYIRYNCPLSSSSPVERLFSQEALELAAKRDRIANKLYETLLLLKLNSPT